MPAQEGDVLELDELWSFVRCKTREVWIWIALCRRTRQIVAYPLGGHPGDRSKESCAQLWAKIPPQYKRGLLFSDLWEAYAATLPAEQHIPCPKQAGETNHVERFNLTLRQRVGRLTRKTLSFSKGLLWHYRHIRLFLRTYNTRKAKDYLARL